MSNYKKLVRARMQKTGESWSTAARHVRAQGGVAPSNGATAEPRGADAVALPPPFVAIVDTNVILDTHSVHDVMGAYDKRYADLDAPELIYRRARARESLLAMMYLNKIKARTFGLHSELLEQLEKNAPSKVKPGTVFESDFTRMFIWFVKERVLPDWQAEVSKKPGGERSNAADAALVDAAKEHGVPLITNEGFSQSGYGEGKIGRRARAAGVTWHHPRRFYEGKIDEAREIAAFLERCRTEAPKYLNDLWRRRGKDKSGELIKMVVSLYRHVLLGETEGRATPVRVAL